MNSSSSSTSSSFAKILYNNRNGVSNFVNFVYKPPPVNFCANCKHFINPSYANLPYTSYQSFGKCKMFGKNSIVTGEIIYDFAELCRNDESKCGEKGAYYQEKKRM